MSEDIVNAAKPRLPLEPLVPEAIVYLPLLGVSKDVVGLRRLLETVLCLWTIGVPVRVKLQSQTAIGLLYLPRISITGHTEYLVVVFLVHVGATKPFNVASEKVKTSLGLELTRTI